MDSVLSHDDDSGRTVMNIADKCSTAVLTGRQKRWAAFLGCIGSHEYFSPEMWRAALAELVATAALMFTLTTSIISCLDSNEPDPKLTVPLSVFVIAFLFLIVTVPLTGGHMSPVFTFIAALKGVVTFARASIYVPAQCIGSILGFLLIKSVTSHKKTEKYSLGGCAIRGSYVSGGRGGVSSATAFLLEFSCTFLVLFVGVTVAFDKRRSKELGLPVVCGVVAASMALAVFVSTTVTDQPGYAGVGLNPARCLGAALIQEGLLWTGQWVFWAGPFSACVIYYAFSINFPREGLLWEEGEHDFVRLAATLLRKIDTHKSFEQELE